MQTTILRNSSSSPNLNSLTNSPSHYSFAQLSNKFIIISGSSLSYRGKNIKEELLPTDFSTSSSRITITTQRIHALQTKKINLTNAHVPIQNTNNLMVLEQISKKKDRKSSLQIRKIQICQIQKKNSYNSTKIQRYYDQEETVPQKNTCISQQNTSIVKEQQYPNILDQLEDEKPIKNPQKKNSFREWIFVAIFFISFLLMIKAGIMK